MTKQQELQKLKAEIQDNNSLPLKETANKLVFGVGSANAEILFLGEGPGYYEDQKGEPFVGNAGKLLDKAINYLGVTRDDVFITNVVMYRPPNNRDPLPAELAAFEPYISEIIKIIKPKVIVTLGRFSMAKFLPNVKITQVHGKVYTVTWQTMKLAVIPMFHPAAALRANSVMQMFKADFVKLKEFLNNGKS